MQSTAHGHECRDCGTDIECRGVDRRNGCETWNGSNDGCPECHPFHDSECRTGFRCVDCYSSTQPSEDSEDCAYCQAIHANERTGCDPDNCCCICHEKEDCAYCQTVSPWLSYWNRDNCRCGA